jgi:hypothetical protein
MDFLKVDAGLGPPTPALVSEGKSGRRTNVPGTGTRWHETNPGLHHRVLREIEVPLRLRPPAAIRSALPTLLASTAIHETRTSATWSFWCTDAEANACRHHSGAIHEGRTANLAVRLDLTVAGIRSDATSPRTAADGRGHARSPYEWRQTGPRVGSRCRRCHAQTMLTGPCSH